MSGSIYRIAEAERSQINGTAVTLSHVHNQKRNLIWILQNGNQTSQCANITWSEKQRFKVHSIVGFFIVSSQHMRNTKDPFCILLGLMPVYYLHCVYSQFILILFSFIFPFLLICNKEDEMLTPLLNLKLKPNKYLNYFCMSMHSPAWVGCSLIVDDRIGVWRLATRLAREISARKTHF